VVRINTGFLLSNPLFPSLTASPIISLHPHEFSTMMFVKTVAVTGLLAASVYGQSTGTSSGPSPSASLSPCLLSCVTSDTTCTFTDATCVCTNTTYQAAILQCLQTNCSADDIALAQSLQASLCGDTSSVPSSTETGTSSTHTGSSLSSVLSSASSRASSLTRTSTGTGTTSPTSTGGSGGGAAGLTVNVLATGGAVLLGIIGGGMLVF